MTEYLSLGDSYLGVLNTLLRDLRGYSTMANELIQNADDAPGATSIVFDVCDDMLVVENNGVFSDCGHMEDEVCRWKSDPTRNHLCDFHRLRKTASGDKRQQSETTGAFGIGFVSVYQVTDQPELISRGRHWSINPSLPEERRIRAERVDVVPGTIFRLPWAFDANTLIRKELTLQPVTRQAIDELVDDLLSSLPGTALFLRKLRRIVLRQWGVDLLSIEREDVDCIRTLHIQNHRTGEQTTEQWLVSRADFSDAAARIRHSAPGKVENKRRTQVEIAVRKLGAGFSGKFHAFLPTQHGIQLPLHINADFFPSADRKRVLFDNDFQGDWNRAAVGAAATALVTALPELRTFLSPIGLWSMFGQARRLWEERQRSPGLDALGVIWERLMPVLIAQPYVHTTTGEWCTPAQVALLQDKDNEAPCVELLQQLNVKVVDLGLNSYQVVLRAVEVEYLTALHLARELRDSGLVGELTVDELPVWAQDPQNWSLVSAEIQVLRIRNQSSMGAFHDCALVICDDGHFAPPAAVRRADEETRQTFRPVARKVCFASDSNSQPIIDLIEKFSINDALAILEEMSASELTELWVNRNADYLQLLGWFASRRADVKECWGAAGRLRRLSIWPANNKLHPLPELVMAGEFKDPLQMAEVLDYSVVERCHALLVYELEASTLTLRNYLISHLPAYFDKHQVRDVTSYLRLLRLLVESYGKIKDDNEIRTRLAGTDLVWCTDDRMHMPRCVYLSSTLVREVLCSETLFAWEWPDDQLPQSYHDVFLWLGVEQYPRADDIVRHIKKIVAEPPSQDSVASIQRIFAHLAQVCGRDSVGYEQSYAALQQLSWLPATKDKTRWYCPSDLFAPYQEYLFSSQAYFLDFPGLQYLDARSLIDFLGIGIAPTTRQVVLHLLHQSNSSETVNKQVYATLEQNFEEPEIALLRGSKCILLANDRYVSPDMVFWNEHYFGLYRFRLNDDFRSYSKLLKALNVRESPSIEDAVAVLKEIACGIGESHDSLDDQTYQVLVHCWHMLASALGDATKEETLLACFQELAELPVIPDDRRILRTPRSMYFIDRPRLPEKFGEFLEHDVIARPQDIWRAMERSGVRPLSQAVRVNVVECEQPETDAQLQSLLRERRPLIMRVVETQKGDVVELSLLERIEFNSVRRLAISYTLTTFGTRAPIPVEEVSAFYDQDTGQMYCVPSDGNRPWPAIARELAYALFPSGDAGQLAPGLRGVLGAPNVELATHELDEMGFAPVQMTEHIGLASSEMIAAGGVITVEDSEPDTYPTSRSLLQDFSSVGASYPSTAGTEALDEPKLNSLGTTKAHDTDAASAGSPDDCEPCQLLSDSMSGSVTKANGVLVTSDPANISTMSALAAHDASQGTQNQCQPKHRRRGQLRTYVMNTEIATHRDDLDTISDEVDRSGIDKVLAYERAAGRHPTEMAHENKGYDIESRDDSGTIVRYIEVKSTLDLWGDMGVGLSKAQFEYAQGKGPIYWLYVVERATQSDAQILRIQDPARKVTQFMYDDGWRSLAETVEDVLPYSGRPSQPEAYSAPVAKRSLLDLKYAIAPVVE